MNLEDERKKILEQKESEHKLQIDIQQEIFERYLEYLASLGIFDEQEIEDIDNEKIL